MGKRRKPDRPDYTRVTDAAVVHQAFRWRCPGCNRYILTDPIEVPEAELAPDVLALFRKNHRIPDGQPVPAGMLVRAPVEGTCRDCNADFFLYTPAEAALGPTGN